jgi:hypothetical protein
MERIPTLDELILWGSRVAEKLFDEGGGEIYSSVQCAWSPKWPTPRGFTLPEDMALVAEMFREEGVERYVLITEAWIAPPEGLPPSEHPERREAVIIAVEDWSGSKTGARHVIRPASGKPTLGPLEIDDHSGPRLLQRSAETTRH